MHNSSFSCREWLTKAEGMTLPQSIELWLETSSWIEVDNVDGLCSISLKLKPHSAVNTCYPPFRRTRKTSPRDVHIHFQLLSAQPRFPYPEPSGFDSVLSLRLLPHRNRPLVVSLYAAPRSVSRLCLLRRFFLSSLYTCWVAFLI